MLSPNFGSAPSKGADTLGQDPMSKLDVGLLLLLTGPGCVGTTRQIVQKCHADERAGDAEGGLLGRALRVRGSITWSSTRRAGPICDAGLRGMGALRRV